MPGKIFSRSPAAPPGQHSAFQCDRCDELFRSVAALRRHRRSPCVSQARALVPGGPTSSSAGDTGTPPAAISLDFVDLTSPSPSRSPAAALAPPSPAPALRRKRIPASVAALPPLQDQPARITCGDCGKTFAERRNLVRHQRAYCRSKRPADPGTIAVPAVPRRHSSCPSEYEALQEGTAPAPSASDSGGSQVKCELCQKTFGTIPSLKQHQRYYCDPSAVLQCRWCDREFPTKIGLGLHCRAAHRLEYEAEVESRDRRKSLRFSGLELYNMVSAELRYSGRDILVHLSGIFGHDRDTIRNFRRTDRYQRELERVRADLEEAEPDVDLTQLPLPSTMALHTAVASAASTPSQPEVFTSGPPDDWHPPSPLPASPRSPRASVGGVRRADPPDPPSGPPSPSPPSSPASPQPDLEDPVAQYIRGVLLDDDTDPDDVTLLSPLLLTTRDAEHILEEFFQRLRGGTRTGACEVRPRQSRRPQEPQHQRRAQLRRRLYRQAQELYKRDRVTLAQRIIDGQSLDNPQITPSLEEVQREYERVFGINDPPPPLPPIHDQGPPLNAGLYAPITHSDIQKQLRMRMSDAAGPDNMHLGDARRISTTRLALLFNCMLLAGVTPPSLRKCRTTLIPKGTDNHHDVTNWRPITVGPILVRIFHRILAQRLASLPLNNAQRGFTSLDGTLANSLALWTIVRQQREASRPYFITTLDLRKAFDTVPHTVIERALRRLGVDQRFIKYVGSTMFQCTTTITCGEHQTAPITIQRGVRQGDPLSPLLFNAVMDELVCKLHATDFGINIGDQKFCVLAYADDLVLVSSSHDHQQHMVRLTERFLRPRAMELNVGKCANLSVVAQAARRTIYTAVNHHYVFLQGGRIPQLGPTDLFKYLGHRFHPAGIQLPDEVDLTSALRRIEKAPLKPWQKLEVIHTYLLPRFFYKFQVPSISKEVLDRADKAIRRSVKSILHLPQQTTNAFLYAEERAGGLGLPCFSARMPDILLARMRNLAGHREDQQLQAMLDSTVIRSLAERLMQLCRPYGLRREQRGYWRSRLESSVPCAGLAAHCEPRPASAWIRFPPSFWDGPTYIRSLQLRAGVLPTVGGLHNQHLPFHERRCRAGCRAVETACHVLQKCPITHYERIRRHDNLVQILAKAARNKGWDVAVEPRYRGTDGRLRKPDLSFSRGRDVIIADVSVSWERPEPLVTAHQNKVAIYSEPPFIQAVRAKHPDCHLSVCALILGARGTWCSLNDHLITALGLDQRTVTSLIYSTLRGGVFIHSAFGRLVWQR